MRFIFHILLHTIAIAAAFWAIEHYIFPQNFQIKGDLFLFSYGFVALVFGALNTFVKPLLKLAMLPIQLITLGVSGFLLNAILLWGLVTIISVLQIQGVLLHVEGLLTYIIAGMILGFANTVIHKVL